MTTPEQQNDRRLQDINALLEENTPAIGTVDGNKCSIGIDIITSNFLVTYDETEVTTTFIIDQTGKILHSFATKLAKSPNHHHPLTRSLLPEQVTITVDDLLAKFEREDNTGMAMDIMDEIDRRAVLDEIKNLIIPEGVARIVEKIRKCIKVGRRL